MPQSQSVNTIPNITFVGRIIAVLGLFIGFFLPWFDLKLFGVIDVISLNAHELVKPMSSVSNLVEWLPIYLIPAGAFIAFLFSLSRKYVLKSSFELLSILAFLWIIFKLILEINEGTNVLYEFSGIGVVVTTFFIIYLMYDIFELKR